MKERITHLLPTIILIFAVTALFYRLLLGEVIFWGVPLLQFYPWSKLAFDLLRSGELPLWNPLVGTGAPLLANYQSAVLYPPNWLHLIVPSEVAMGIVGVLHLIWAGIGMMLYLRVLRVGRLGQGIGALSFALSGYLIGRFGFLSITNTVPWLPWIVWSVDRLFRTEANRIQNLLILGCTTSMLLLAGHAQSAFYTLLLSGCYALWLTFSAQSRRWRSLVFAGMGVLLGILIAAVQLLPTLEYMRLSQRSTGFEAAHVLTYSFWPWRFLTLISPNLFGSPATGDYWGYAAYWEDAVYVGFITFILAIRSALAWWRVRRDWMPANLQIVPFYAVTLMLAYFLALGQNNPIFLWLYERIPGANLFQAPTRWTLLAVFAMCVLAGIGAQHWQTVIRGQVWARRSVVIGIAVVIGALFAQIRLGEAINPTLITGMLRVGILTCLVAVAALLLRRVEFQPARRPLWEAAVLALLAIDLVTAHWGLNPTIAVSYYHQPSALATALRSETAQTRTIYTFQGEYDAKFDHFFQFNDFGANDIEHWTKVKSSLLPNLGMIDGVPSASNFDPLLVRRWNGVIAPLDILDRDEQIERLRQLNVSVLLSPDAIPGLDLIAHSDPIFAYRVPDPWPRVFVSDCKPAEDIQCESMSNGSAAIVSESANSVRIEVDAPNQATVILLDTYYPGWRATVDGSPAQIWLANDAFRAVEVDAGKHLIEYQYRPQSFSLGVTISTLALLVSLALWFYSRKRQ